MKINFHIHTNCSDGAINPSQMVRVMKGKKFDCIALTDHDTTKGNLEAHRLCENFDIKFIPGVEITSYLDESIGLYDDSYKLHILGLGINSSKVGKALKDVESKKIKYHRQIMTGYIPKTILSKCDFDLGNRVSCAELLVSLNVVDSLEKAMSIFKISPYAMSIKDTIDTIHNAGGIAIWAHPFILPKNGGFKITAQDVSKIYDYMNQMKIDGMEGFYLQFSEEDQNFIKEICDTYSAFCSTGTDFHADYEFEYNLLNVRGRYDKNLLETLRIV